MCTRAPKGFLLKVVLAKGSPLLDTKRHTWTLVTNPTSGATGQCRTVAALVPARLILGAGRSAAEGGDRAYLADLTERCPEARGTAGIRM